MPNTKNRWPTQHFTQCAYLHNFPGAFACAQNTGICSTRHTRMILCARFLLQPETLPANARPEKTTKNRLLRASPEQPTQASVSAVSHLRTILKIALKTAVFSRNSRSPAPASSLRKNVLFFRRYVAASARQKHCACRVIEARMADGARFQHDGTFLLVAHYCAGHTFVSACPALTWQGSEGD